MGDKRNDNCSAKVEMTAQTKVKAAPTGLALLREPFAANHISKLPKPTKQQTEIVRNDFKKGIRCKDCGAWHHPDVVHLDYVGHAALTDRLLDADPEWSWEPAAFTEQGLPAFDQSGGLWIKLTVCGVTRLGYGHAAGKQNQDPGAREKEVIGDALRNAAMRFGAALDLWHKGQLHATDSASCSSPGTLTAGWRRPPERTTPMPDSNSTVGGPFEREEFCARFKARMLERAGPTFDDGSSIADYADETAPTYWETDWQRENGPEQCADDDMSYWGDE